MSLARNLSKFKPSSSGLVETADIADDAITTAKVLDANITTAKVADDAVTTAKVNPSQTDITSVGTLTSATVSGDLTVGDTLLVDESADKVGINSSNYYRTLTMYGSGESAIQYQNSTTGGASSTVGMYSGLYQNDFYHQLYANGRQLFYTNNTYAMAIEADGDVTIANGDLVIGTAGHGIDFSAQTLSSNIVGSPKSEVLEHYETGQFNADITSTTGSGDVTIYNHALGVTENQASRYIRIGSLVTIFGSHVVQSWGSRTGTLRIANLPFPIWGGGGYSGSPTHFPADTRDTSVTMSGGGSYFQFSKNNGTLVAGTSEHWQISDLMTMKYLTYTFTYFTNIT